MKKFLCTVLVLALVVLSSSCLWADYYDEGHYGLTESDAYIIDSLEDLMLLRTCVNEGKEPRGRYYKLVQNIEVSSNWNQTIGDYENTPFEGHFNGNGNTITIRSSAYSLLGRLNTDGTAIKYLNVNHSGNVYQVNIFGGIAAMLLSGTIENCSVSGNISISCGYKGDYNYYGIYGGIAGSVGAKGVIKNCNFDGALSGGHDKSGTEFVSYVGGIAGSLEGGTISNCTVTITDSIYAYTGGSGGTEVRNSCAGGIVGEATESSTIRNCRVTGVVRSKQWAGGIVGYMQGGTLSNCYVLNTSTVEGNFAAGGIAGYLGGNAVASENAIVLMSRVEAVEQAVGGIIGRLNSGTVRNNRAYTNVDGRAKYQGTIIGEAIGYPNTVTGNYYNVSGSATNVIGYDLTLQGGSDVGGNQHKPETIEQIIKNDPVPVTTINITKSSLANGTVGTSYNDVLTADVSGVTWSVSRGTLPAGLSLNTSTGAIAGVPTTANTYSFTITATSANSSASKEFTIVISSASTPVNPDPIPVTTITILNSSLPNASIGNSYSVELFSDASNVTWSVSNGTLPAGLTLNASTGRISGTPQTAGNYTFTLRASNSSGSGEKSFTITVNASPSPAENNFAITTMFLSDGTVGTPYSQQLTATKSVSSWRVSNGALPGGLSLSQSGLLSGTPTTAGTTTIEITASNGTERTSSYFTLTINAVGSLTITSSSEIRARENEAVAFTFTANISGVKWYADASLPAGLSLNPDSGALRGTATAKGTYPFTVTAIGNGQSASRYITFIVDEAAKTNDDKEGEDGGSGGGCNSLAGLYGLVALAGIFLLRKK